MNNKFGAKKTPMQKDRIIVTCGIIFRKSKILVARRSEQQSHPGKWEFPGGKVKQSESLEVCLARELHEELNIGVEILGKLSPVNMEYEDFYIELHPFICKTSDQSIILREHEQIKWCGIDELKQLDLTGADAKLVRQMKEAGGEPAIKEQR